MATQSRLLTGILTGLRKWNSCGDAQFIGRRSGMPLPYTPETEAERLARVGSSERTWVTGIKTGNAFRK